MTSPTYVHYDKIELLPPDPVVEQFEVSMEVIITPPQPKFTFSNPAPPSPGGGIDPNVDHNRVLLPMKQNAVTVGENQRGVQYESASGRERYRVVIGKPMTRMGAVFDTAAIKANYFNPGSGLGMQDFGATRPADYDEWGREAIMWVCAVPPGQATGLSSVAFYSHVCRIGKMHHSSFVSGGEIVGAGEWIVKDGKLLKVSANSGHYQPTIDFLYRSVLHMASAATPGETTILLWDSTLKKWVNRAWADFISKPSDNGRYWTHPNAALASA